LTFDFWIEINYWAKRGYLGIRKGTGGKGGQLPLFKGHGGGAIPPFPAPLEETL